MRLKNIRVITDVCSMKSHVDFSPWKTDHVSHCAVAQLFQNHSKQAEVIERYVNRQLSTMGSRMSDQECTISLGNMSLFKVIGGMWRKSKYSFLYSPSHHNGLLHQ